MAVLDIVERHAKAMLADIRDVFATGSVASAQGVQSGSAPAASGTVRWSEIARLTGSYDWPPDHGGHEEYDPFVLYQADGLTLAIGLNVRRIPVKGVLRKHVWVFKVDPDGSRMRPITPFISTDDYGETRELVSIIRGNGETRRKMFNPGESLPPPYDDLRVEVLRDRIAGHYRKRAVVVHEDDVEAMLRHGAAQLRMKNR